MLAKKGLLPLFYLGESGLIIKNRGRVTKLSWPFGAISQSNYIDTDHLQFMKFLKKMKSLQSIIWSNWKWNRIYFQQDIWKNRFTHPWWYLGIWYSYILRFFLFLENVVMKVNSEMKKGLFSQLSKEMICALKDFFSISFYVLSSLSWSYCFCSSELSHHHY